MKAGLIRHAACGLLAMAAASSAVANKVGTFLIDAQANSVAGGHELDTGIFLNAGERFAVTVPVTDTWNNSGTDPFTFENANGSSSQHPLWCRDLHADVGSLVGQLGDGPFFKVGTTFSGAAFSAGELRFVFWDTDAWNNLGSIHATVQTLSAASSVPEAGSIAMLSMGLCLIGLSRRRKHSRR